MKMTTLVNILILILGLVFVESHQPRNDWSKLDLDEVERQWNADEDEDFVTKDEELYQEGERRREEAMMKLNKLMETSPKGGGPGSADFESLAAEAQNAGKPAMIFAQLHPKKNVPPEEYSSLYGPRKVSVSKDWDWDSMAALCDEWEDRLFYAMLEITCFPITDQSSILVTVKRGWDGEKVYQFLKEHQYKFVRELKWEDRIEKISIPMKSHP